jgi:hypothetical protein
MGNWIQPDGEATTITLPRSAIPILVELFGKALVGGGQIATILRASSNNPETLTLDVQPMREFDDPEIPADRWWRKVYGVIDLDRPFLNTLRIT